MSVNALAGDEEGGKGRKKAFAPAPAAAIEPVQAPAEEIQPEAQESAPAVEAEAIAPEIPAEEGEVTE